MMAKRMVCIVCKREFWTRGNTAKYCSPRCRRISSYHGKDLRRKGIRRESLAAYKVGGYSL